MDLRNRPGRVGDRAAATLQGPDRQLLVALRNLLRLILPHASDAEIDDLARRRFTNKEIRKQVDTLLHSIDLDASAIEVEAYRSSIPDFAAIDRRLTELAHRRDKIFRQIEDRRAGIAVPPRHRHVDLDVPIEDDEDT